MKIGVLALLVVRDLKLTLLSYGRSEHRLDQKGIFGSVSPIRAGADWLDRSEREAYPVNPS